VVVPGITLTHSLTHSPFPFFFFFFFFFFFCSPSMPFSLSPSTRKFMFAPIIASCWLAWCSWRVRSLTLHGFQCRFRMSRDTHILNIPHRTHNVSLSLCISRTQTYIRILHNFISILNIIIKQGSSFKFLITSGPIRYLYSFTDRSSESIQSSKVQI
jgi:hypothetical protein